MKGKVVNVCNEKPHTLLVKDDFDSDLKEISVQRTFTKHGRPTGELPEKIIKQKYSASLRVSDEKERPDITLSVTCIFISISCILQKYSIE